MSIASLLVLVAVAASVALIAQESARLFPAFALVASGLEALIAFRLINFSARSVNIWLILAILLAVAGVACWTKASSKTSVSAATAIILIACIQLTSHFLNRPLTG